MSERPSLTTLSLGHAYPEGPCIGADGQLYVVELAGGVLARIVDGRREVVVATPGAPNGAVACPDGSIVFCNNGGNWGPNASTDGMPGLGGGVPRLQRWSPDGSLVTLLSEIDGVALRAPNDVVRDRHGGLWFTDPAWATRDAQGSAAASASPPGALCYVNEDGSGAVRIHDGLVFPNGLAITPDESGLVVGETGTGRVLRFEIRGPGLLSEPELFADLGVDSFPDGMCFDSSGALLVAGTGSGAVFVVDSAGGAVSRIPMEDIDVTNLCFAGVDGRDLIITEASLGRVSVLRWPVPGARLPGSPSSWS